MAEKRVRNNVAKLVQQAQQQDAQKPVEPAKKQNIEFAFYSGPEAIFQHRRYEDIAGYQVNDHWIAVMMKDGTTHVFRGNSVDELTVSYDKE